MVITTYGGFKGFTMINNVLTPIEATKITITPSLGLVYETNEGTLFDPKIYADADAFERGVCVSIDVYMNDKNVYLEEIDGVNTLTTTVFVMKDGEPVQTKIHPSAEINQNDRAKISIGEGVYLSRRDCLCYETYEIKDSDGNISRVDGLGKRLRLDDEQTDYVNNVLVPALKKAESLGIELLYSVAYDELAVINKKNAPKLVADCEYDMSEGEIFVRGIDIPTIGVQICGFHDDTVFFD